MVAGSAQHIAEQTQIKALDANIDGAILNTPAYSRAVITAFGDALRPLVGR